MTLTLQDVNTVKDKERMRNFSVYKSIKEPDINTVILNWTLNQEKKFHKEHLENFEYGLYTIVFY